MSLTTGSRLHGAVVLLALLLPGCVTYKHVPVVPATQAVAPDILQKRTAVVQQEHADLAIKIPVGEGVSREVASWFSPEQSSQPDFRVEITETAKEDKALLLGILFIAYPTFSHGSTVSELVITADGQEVFRDRQETRMRRSISILPWPLLFGSMEKKQQEESLRQYIASSHRAAIARRVQEEQSAFDASAAQGTAEALEQYLTANSRSFFRGEALRKLSLLAARSRNPAATHKAYSTRYPDYSRFIADVDELRFVGPAGMKIADIQASLARGVSPEVLAANIRAARQPYRVFSVDEMAWLEQKRIPALVVMAMLDATREAGSMVAVASAAMPTMSAQPAMGMAAGGLAPDMAAPAQPQSLGEKVAGGAAECAKAFLARKACEKIPDPTGFGFLIKACIKKVKQTYGGAGCPML